MSKRRLVLLFSLVLLVLLVSTLYQRRLQAKSAWRTLADTTDDGLADCGSYF